MQAPIHSDLRAAFKAAFDEIVSFVSSPGFVRMLDHLYGLPLSRQVVFVKEVMLDPQELATWGVALPEGISLHRPAPGDRQESLFCVARQMPAHLRPYLNEARLTFDHTQSEAAVLEPHQVWKQPMSTDMLSELLGEAPP